ncbi:type I glyceraldehyde-3-phosphate dehydrogenase [Candidatus Woesearchaeota archaeon]|nr:type I glyceraldehyde-3-phosphate dehydrogenase [Candidatus Woesearchaeota archaeon]
MIKVGINGFGRIGRMVFRAAQEHNDIDVVAVNDLGNPSDLKYMLQYDSVHKAYPGEVSSKDDLLIVDGKEIKIFSSTDPAQIPWHEHGVDVVVECTGRFRKKEDAEKHITGGKAKKVIISAPGKGGIKSLVMGVNEDIYDKENDHVVSNASCTTNCLAPVAKVLNDNYGIEKGFMTTTHSYTADQLIVDGHHKKDPRRGRAAAQNIVPTSTGAAIAVTECIPELKGKLDGIALRVPVPCGSIVDLNAVLKKEVSKDELHKLFEDVCKTHMKGILQLSFEPLVSSDILGNNHSSIVDGALTMVNGNMVKITAWYDNEWGYSHRMVDMIRHVMK